MIGDPHSAALMMALSFVLIYTAVVALYHAHPLRAATWLSVRLQPLQLTRLRWLGAVLLLSAVVSIVVQSGLARGISMWLGIVGLCAAASLGLATVRPKLHLWSPLGVAGVAALLEIGRFVL